MNTEIYMNEKDMLQHLSKDRLINFLHDYLDIFRDSKDDISKALEYAFSGAEGKGGFVVAAYEGNDLVGAVLMNNTGMSGYIPENILVYVAVHEKMRGKGIGRVIIEEAIRNSKGNVALHVEYDNPAKRLYERIGFKSKYAEMRFDK